MDAEFADFDQARRAVAGFLASRFGIDVTAEGLITLDAGESPAPEADVPTRETAAPSPPERPLVSLLSALLATVQAKEREAEQHQRRVDQIYAEAHRDELTGVANRAAWNRAVMREERRCRRYGNPAAIVLIDLDDLKHTNDTFGHAVGDALLRRAARALASSARRPDVVARMGGDEFAVLALNCDAGGLAILEQRIRTALDGAQVSASVGSAMRNDADGLAGAMVRADQAMYGEKRTRRQH